MQTIEIRKRKHFTKSQKLEILNELKTNDMTIAAMARRYEIHPVTLHQWKRNMSKPQEPKKDEDLKEVLSENEKLKEIFSHGELSSKTLVVSFDPSYYLEVADGIQAKEETLGALKMVDGNVIHCNRIFRPIGVFR